MNRPSLAALTGGIGAPPVPAVDPPPAAEPAPAAPATSRAPRPRQGRKPAAASEKHAVPIYLPAEVLARIRAAVATTGETYSDWMLDAYDRVHARLGEKFPSAGARASGLPPRAHRRRRRVANPVAVQLRLTETEEAVLEARRAELGGPSKSAFYTAIAELGLGG